ncbi:MAG: hypothetical protein EA356_05340 [Geminicoccaceae bacterium]|nr:MAG: hypothetical protein EA356_05340 [Geminicoccaceae bacterium]
MSQLATNASTIGQERCASAIDLKGFVERLEERLPWLLPGEVTVEAAVPSEAILAAVPGDALEELVAELLTSRLPLRAWRYTVRVEVIRAIEPQLVLVLDLGEANASPRPAPSSLEVRIDDLAIRIRQDATGRSSLALPGGQPSICQQPFWVRRLTEAGIPARCTGSWCADPCSGAGIDG